LQRYAISDNFTPDRTNPSFKNIWPPAHPIEKETKSKGCAKLCSVKVYEESVTCEWVCRVLLFRRYTRSDNSHRTAKPESRTSRANLWHHEIKLRGKLRSIDVTNNV